MKALIVTVVALALWAGPGCSLPRSSSPALPGGDALPPPADAAEPGGGSTAAPAAPAAETGGTAGESGTVIESIQPDPSAAEGPTAITIPEGAGWTRPGVPLTKQQADIEACFTFAEAQIDRETQIDNDLDQVGGDRDFEDQYGVKALTRRVDYYSERRRRGALFDSCMESKGYVKD